MNTVPEAGFPIAPFSGLLLIVWLRAPKKFLGRYVGHFNFFFLDHKIYFMSDDRSRDLFYCMLQKF